MEDCPHLLRVAVADPHLAVAEAVACRLGREADVTAVGTAATVPELLALADRARPHVVLSELHLDGRPAFEAVDRLGGRRDSARFVILTAAVVDAFVAEAARRGAGYLLKTEPIAAVVAGVREAAAGEPPFSEAAWARLRRDPVTGRLVLRPDSHLTGLTARQLEVLRLLARGGSVRGVAAELGLTEKGVESHRYRIMNRLGIRTRVGLARYAIREGVLPP